jgi:hypothetical protein
MSWMFAALDLRAARASNQAGYVSTNPRGGKHSHSSMPKHGAVGYPCSPDTRNGRSIPRPYEINRAMENEKRIELRTALSRIANGRPVDPSC